MMCLVNLSITIIEKQIKRLNRMLTKMSKLKKRKNPKNNKYAIYAYTHGPVTGSGPSG